MVAFVKASATLRRLSNCSATCEEWDHADRLAVERMAGAEGVELPWHDKESCVEALE